MATTIVQAATSPNGTSPVDFTFASNPTAGNLLVAWVSALSSTSHTLAATNGFAALTHATQGNPDGYLFWKVADSTDALSATVSVATLNGSQTGQGVMVEVSTSLGWDANSVLAESANSIASTTSYATDTLSPTSGVADCLAVCGYANTNSKNFSSEAVSGTNVGTVTEQGETNSTAMATAVISSTSGNYQGTATCSNPGAAGFAAIAIFKPAASTPVTYTDTAAPAITLTRSSSGFVKRLDTAVPSVLFSMAASGFAKALDTVAPSVTFVLTGSANPTTEAAPQIILDVAPTGVLVRMAQATPSVRLAMDADFATFLDAQASPSVLLVGPHVISEVWPGGVRVAGSTDVDLRYNAAGDVGSVTERISTRFDVNAITLKVQD